MVKPGLKTTEFYISLVPTLLGLLAAFGVIGPEKVEPLTKAITQIVGGAVAGLTAFGYALSRGKAKAK